MVNGSSAAELPALSAHKRLGFRPQLNSLRAFSIFLVMFTHFWAGEELGGPGLQMFFVLSGFLITSILLDQKAADMPLRSKLRAFFARRIIRIWPLFYTVLVLACLVDLDGIRASGLWHLTHMSDVYYMRRDDWYPSVAAHLWSLSLQEKFYLVWPFAVLLLPLNRLVLVIGAIIVAAVGTGVISLVYYPAIMEAVRLASYPIGALATGAALAVAPQLGITFERLRAWLAPAALVAVIATGLIALAEAGQLVGAVQRSLYNVLCAYLAVLATIGVGGLTGRIMENRALGFIGQISYGIYLLHNFVSPVVRNFVNDQFGYFLPYNSPATFAIMSSTTVLLAVISWYVFERPINSLKKHFPYRGTGERAALRDGASRADAANGVPALARGQ